MKGPRQEIHDVLILIHITTIAEEVLNAVFRLEEVLAVEVIFGMHYHRIDPLATSILMDKATITFVSITIDFTMDKTKIKTIIMPEGEDKVLQISPEGAAKGRIT